MSFVPHVYEDELKSVSDYRSVFNSDVVDSSVGLLMIGKQSITKKVTGVIKPSFDWSLDVGDAAFKSSYVPFADPNKKDPKLPAHPAMTPWITPYRCYRFLKPSATHFLAPSNKVNMIGGDNLTREDTMDAINDLRLWIIKNLSEQKDYYLKKPSPTEDARVPNSDLVAFANATVRDSDNPKDDRDAVICMTSSAKDYCFDQLRWRTPYSADGSVKGLDPDFPAYLLGDVTNPERALVWSVAQRSYGTTGRDINLVVWTEEEELPPDQPQFRKISQDQLVKRVNFYDPKSWNFPTYQELLDYLVDYCDEVPMEIIKRACGHRGHVKERNEEEIEARKRKDAEGKAGSGGSMNAPSAYEPPTRQTTPQQHTPPPELQSGPTEAPAAPTDDAPPPAPAEVKYWVFLNGDRVQHTEDELQKLADEGVDAKVYKDSAWKTLAEAGFLPKPKAVVVVDDLPPMPDDAAGAPPPPTAPDETTTPEVTDDELRSNFPGYDSFDDGKKRKAREVTEKVNYHKRTSGSVPPDLAMEMMELQGY